MSAGFASVFLLVACSPASKYAASSWQFAQDQRIFQGTQPLQWDNSLFTLADNRARYMADNLDFNHDMLYFHQNVAGHDWACEIIGRQPLIDPGQNIAVLDSIAQGWLKSPAHASCMLGSQFKYAAISGYVGSDGWVYESMWITD